MHNLPSSLLFAAVILAGGCPRFVHKADHTQLAVCREEKGGAARSVFPGRFGFLRSTAEYPYDQQDAHARNEQRVGNIEYPWIVQAEQLDLAAIYEVAHLATDWRQALARQRNLGEKPIV